MILGTKFLFLILCLLLQFKTYAQIGSLGNNKNLAVKSIKMNLNADSLQYAVGIYVGQWMSNNRLYVELTNYFIEGLKDGVNKKNRAFNDSMMSKLVMNYQYNNLGEKGRRQEIQLLNSLKDKPNIGMLPNGVRYMILKKGTGKLPLETDSLQLHIYARLTDSTVLENTYLNKQPVINAPANFFPGLRESLLMMSAGSKWQLYIPANQAFGEKGNMPRIPPNSPLIIDVEIVAFNKNN